MKSELNKEDLRTWVEIDKQAIKHNVRVFRSLIRKPCRLCAVVKSNAYGHGIYDFSPEALKAGADWLGVDSLIEAIRLREKGVKVPILVLGYTVPSLFKKASQNDISLTISTFESLQVASNLKVPKKLKVHIKIDSGMSRQGFFLGDIKEVISIFKKSKSIIFEGLYTHFADAKNPAFPDNTYKQIKIFDEAVLKVKGAGFDPIVHAAATSATIIFPETHFDMVRCGIGIYGLWPSKETQSYAKNFIDIKPVLSWKSILSEVKVIEKGRGVGYGFTERVKKKTKIGIVPVGYWHGYQRDLSSIANVSVNGKLAKVLGRVSMDMIVVDLSKVKNPKVGDEIVLLGGAPKEETSADILADLANTINYEMITRINPLIKRVVK